MNGKVGSKSVGFYSVMEAYGTATNYPSPVESYRPRSPPRAKTPPRRSCDGHTSPRSVSFGIKRDEAKDKRQKYLTARYGQHQMMLIRKRLAVEDWVYESLRDLYNCENDDDDHDCKLDLEDILNLDTDSERQQYATINSTAESVFRRNVDDMIAEAGCIRRRNTFVYFHLGNKTDGPTNWLALSQFNNARNIQKADVEETLSDAKQTSELVNKFIKELLQKAKTL